MSGSNISRDSSVSNHAPQRQGSTAPSIPSRGETVLTRVEADQWRAGTSPAAAADPAALADAVARALSGVTVQMDGRTVGRLVAGEVSAVLGTQTRARRYTG